MKKDNNLENETLRQKAEDIKKKKLSKNGSLLVEADALKLIHELEVHQIELELQNEELILARVSAQDSLEKYTELYDFAPSGYFTLSKEGQIIDLNLRAASKLGKDRSFLKNKKLGIYISDDTKSIFNLFLEKVFKSKNKETCEVCLINEGKITLNVFLSGIVDEKLGQCLLNMVDITKRKQAEEKMNQALKNWDKTFNSIQDGIILLDVNQKIIQCNQAFLDIVCTPKDEIFGKHCYHFVHGTDCPVGECPFVLMQDSIKREMTEMIINGLVCKVMVDPILDDKKNIIGAVHIVTDITDQKQAEKAVIENQRLGAIGEMASSIAHDFNNSLQSIFGNVELAMFNKNNPETTQEYLKTIKSAAKDAASRVQQIQRFGGTKQSGSKYSSVDMNALISEVINETRPMWKDDAEQNGITLEIKSKSGNIPEVLGNTGELRSVLFNIFKNGFEQCPKAAVFM